MGKGRPHKCPYCEATTSVAKGFRYNKSGKVRLRRCKACGRRWTTGSAPPETEVPQQQTSENQITEQNGVSPPSESSGPETEDQRTNETQEGDLGRSPDSPEDGTVDPVPSNEDHPSQDELGEQERGGREGPW